MGRASSMASSPPHSDSRGSAFPIENSPPGTQTIPSGASPGAGVLLGIVGPKSEASGSTTDAVATGFSGAVADSTGPDGDRVCDSEPAIHAPRPTTAIAATITRTTSTSLEIDPGIKIFVNLGCQ